MKAQSSFSERLARIETQSTFGGADAYTPDDLVQSDKPQRRLHWDMMAAGGIAGGVVGTLFAMQFGLMMLAALDVTSLYQLLLADYTKALLLLGVLIAPVGFVMSQIFSRSNPRGWQLWIGYFAGVIAANFTDIQSYYYYITTVPT